MNEKEIAKNLLLGYRCRDCIDFLRCIMGDLGDEYTRDEVCEKWKIINDRPEISKEIIIK